MNERTRKRKGSELKDAGEVAFYLPVVRSFYFQGKPKKKFLGVSNGQVPHPENHAVSVEVDNEVSKLNKSPLNLREPAKKVCTYLVFV